MTEKRSLHNLLPDPARSALLIVDIQDRLVTAMPGEVSHRVVRNASVLIQTANEFNMPVLVSEQYPRGLGSTVPEIKAVLPEHVTPVEKMAFSCCNVPAFQALLAGIGQRDIILCGIEAHVCVLQTALDLLQNGRRVYLAADAMCSRYKNNWRIGLNLMQQAGAVVGSTEIFTFALLGKAGTDQFKQISKLVK